jgi:hypothetical protein
VKKLVKTKTFTIYSYRDGKILRKATNAEYNQYLAETKKKPKEDQLSGEVKGEAYGLTGMIYMQETSDTGQSGIKSEITYFEVAGNRNSEETLKLAQARALERGIKTIIIASIRGETALKALETFKDTDINLIMATCNACNGCDRFSEKIWHAVEKAGHKVIYTNEDAVPFPPDAVLAYRRMCEGMKVCVQISMSAVDQGFISSGTNIIAIAGTGGKGWE